jgi:CheY-like chemotaxis protein/HPt (histidine-containing phosphotransfer) domain-containing protein/anti-sigma regulatory factor (Ser/Thr protein kinase)
LLLDTGLDAEQRGLAETIRFSGESLLDLINDILDFSKIEAGQISLEKLDFDLRDLVDDTVKMMAIQAQAKGIKLASDVAGEIPRKLRGDAGRVRQVLTNLIGNAIKFTKEGEVAVHCRVEAEAETNVTVRFEIKDTGMGISSETQALLFQPFVQADSSTSRRFGGTGLGLAICKRLADLMNGSIGVESAPGHGSTFWVTMQFSRPKGTRAEAPTDLGALPRRSSTTKSGQLVPFIRSGAPESPRKERVLLAEDNKVNQQVALGNLRQLGYKADVAANGFEVLEATARKNYDIILMDCQMPEMDGYEVTREIRQREREGRRAYIIATTANAMVGDREKCLAVGMDDYVSKPLNRVELRAALQRGTAQPVSPLNENTQLRVETDDKNEAAQWIELFAATAPGGIVEMKRAHAESRADDLARAAHSLKGSSSNFGASALVNLCAQIEDAVRSGNLEGMGDLIAAAEKELDRVIEALRTDLKADYTS